MYTDHLSQEFLRERAISTLEKAKEMHKDKIYPVKTLVNGAKVVLLLNKKKYKEFLKKQTENIKK